MYAAFDSKEKIGKQDSLESDLCCQTAREQDSTKAFKFYTQNFFDQDVKLDRGINFSDGFGIPSKGIDISSTFRQGQPTKLKFPASLPAFPLPTTASFARGRGDVAIEDSLRAKGNSTEKKHEKPRESNYYRRNFQIFDSLPIYPNMCYQNYVAPIERRQGIDTRHA